MDKSPDAFRTISEVSEWLDTPAHVLRFWESRFPQIRPVKRAGGRRYYRPADVALLGGIKKLLHDDGLTIRGVQKMLREQGIRHVAALAGGEEAVTAEAAAAPDAAAATQLPFDLGGDPADAPPAAQERPAAPPAPQPAPEPAAAPAAEPMLEDPVVEESLLARQVASASPAPESTPPAPAPETPPDAAPVAAPVVPSPPAEVAASLRSAPSDPPETRRDALRALYLRLSDLRDRMAEAGRRAPR